jgi:hypothetical protein
MRLVPKQCYLKTNWEKPKREQKEIMKNYYARVKLEWSQFGIEGKNKAEAIKQLKAIFLEQYNIELADKEIVEIVVDEPQGE